MITIHIDSVDNLEPIIDGINGGAMALIAVAQGIRQDGKSASQQDLHNALRMAAFYLHVPSGTGLK